MKIGDKLWLVIDRGMRQLPDQEPVTVTKLGTKYAYLSNFKYRMNRDTLNAETDWTARESGHIAGQVWPSEDAYLCACRRKNTWMQIQSAFNSYRAIPPASYEEMLLVARILQVEIK